jgi:hypothetical protein
MINLRIMNREINDIQDVKNFALFLVNEQNLNFHPDDDFSNYINLETSLPIYSEEEAKILNFQMDRCFEICDEHGSDIYELMGKPLFDKLNKG